MHCVLHKARCQVFALQCRKILCALLRQHVLQRSFREGRGWPVIFLVTLMTLCSAFLCAMVQLETHTEMQYVSALSVE